MNMNFIIENDNINHELIKKYNQLESIYDEAQITDNKIILDEHQANALVLIKDQINILLELRRIGSGGGELLKD